MRARQNHENSNQALSLDDRTESLNQKRKHKGYKIQGHETKVEPIYAKDLDEYMHLARSTILKRGFVDFF